MIRSVLEIAGIMVFAASGVLSAGRKGMDLVGVAVIAVVTALGGGTLRDLLLERHPVSWIANTSYLWACLAAFTPHGQPSVSALILGKPELRAHIEALRHHVAWELLQAVVAKSSRAR